MDVLPSLLKWDVTIGASYQRIDPAVPPIVEREPPVITSSTKNDYPEAIPGVSRSSQVIVQTKQD